MIRVLILIWIPIFSYTQSSQWKSYLPINTANSFNPSFKLQSSHLPIININTHGQGITNEPKIMADIGIIYNGEGNTNYTIDPYNEYHGKCGIEIRGESSQGYDKKSYLFEFWDEDGQDMDTSFLNFPAEEDFILYGPYADRSLINNVLAMKLARDIGQYASWTRFVELIINEEYQGLYVVMEKIKRDKNRVDIAKLNPNEISGDDLTGGYIVRLDKGEYQGWNSKYNAFGTNKKIFFQYVVPDQDEIQEEQEMYIQNYFHRFEEAMVSPDYTNDQGKRYYDYINIRSFVDNFIINELSKNVDAYRFSTYFYKDKNSKGGKIVAGPIWDYNFSFGNADYCGGDQINGWIYEQCDHGGIPFWWSRLMEDPFFQNALRCRWDELRENELATDKLHHAIDSMVLEIGPAADRNFERWPIFGSYIWPNPDYYLTPDHHGEIIETLKNRLENRLVWMDFSIPGVAENCDYYEDFDEMTTETKDLTLDENRVHIYPNPTSSILQIESINTIHNLELYNIYGQKIYEEKSASNTLTVDLTSLSSGTYLLHVRDDKERYSKILIKQ